MATDELPRGRRGRAGFTLIEVVVAMVILAVGLLALEGLAIGASRRVASANRYTEFTLIGTQDLETSLERIRRGQNPGARDDFLANGTRVQRVVNPVVVVGGQGGTVWNVSVTVTPPANNLNLRPVTVTGRVYN